jgi:Tfp pilus assembly protein PilF
LNDRTGMSACYNNLGSVCYAQNQFGPALMWYELDLHLSEVRGAWTDMAATLHNMGHVALEMNEPERALDYFRQSKALYSAFQLTEYVEEEQEMIDLIEAELAQNDTKKRRF